MLSPNWAALVLAVLVLFGIGVSVLMDLCSGRSAVANMGFAALAIAVLVLGVLLLVQVAMQFAPAY